MALSPPLLRANLLLQTFSYLIHFHPQGCGLPGFSVSQARGPGARGPGAVKCVLHGAAAAGQGIGLAPCTHAGRAMREV